MIHLGDITKISGYEAPPVDVICGGSPCQDLSIAGLRKGLEGERSGLFMEQVRIIKEMRKKHEMESGADEPVRPRWCIWENVKGAFSSPGGKRKGEDFRAVLTEFVRIVCDGAPDVPMPAKNQWKHAGVLYGVGDGGRPFSIAWRLHDAQYHGVPQRRSSVCVLCDFDGYLAGEILFDLHDGRSAEEDYKDLLSERAGTVERETDQVSVEREGVPGRAEPGGTAGQETAGDDAGNFGTAISFVERGGRDGGGKGLLIQDEKTSAVKTKDGQRVCYCIDQNVCRQGSVVRRMTELESERLQGFPDGWTDIGEWTDSKGKKHKPSGTPRYKALGNSIALPFWQWLANRISAVYDRPVEIASLFDGIGGFPLVFERAGGKAVWASEIEEFPIAVTKLRFPE